MELIGTVAALQNLIRLMRLDGKTIGFVPTMGALHEGHLSLVRECIANNDICIVSIFVNPTQFNNKEDLVKYPRNLEQDSNLLQNEGVDIIFAPSESEIYPEQDTRLFNFGLIDKVMEGVHRPGHFNGVAQIVSRLFDIIEPDKAYFGEKDFQQLAIVRDMVNQLNMNVEVMPMPIMREKSGLAMSSRNERLTETQRTDAAYIFETLSKSKGNHFSVAETRKFVVDQINTKQKLKVEYFEIVDGKTLQPIKEWSDTNYAVGCIAVFCGDVRLIDNITY